MAVVSVQQAISGQHAPGSEVTVRGWVRTRRDSKAGLSFVHLHDGSGFHPIQVVAPGERVLAAPIADLYKNFGITAAAIVQAVTAKL